MCESIKPRQAFLRLDGFANPPTLESLAKDSKLVFDRYPLLKQSELSEKLQQSEPDSAIWLTYWKNNPIKFSCSNNKKTDKQWFKIKDNRLVANFDVRVQDKPALHDAVQELLTLRLLQYSQRPNKVSSKEAVNQQENNSLIKRAKATQLAFYPNLKIACGHFKTGDDSQVSYMDAPEGYGHLLAEKHFLANATGNSMNGGKHPILDGDLLLLELITPESAGSLQGQTVVIENQDGSGDAQYLLRDVKKLGDGRYQLLPKNSDYEPIFASEAMKPLARLKGVVK